MRKRIFPVANIVILLILIINMAPIVMWVMIQALDPKYGYRDNKLISSRN